MGGKGNGDAYIALHTNPPITFLEPLESLPNLKLYYKVQLGIHLCNIIDMFIISNNFYFYF